MLHKKSTGTRGLPPSNSRQQQPPTTASNNSEFNMEIITWESTFRKGKTQLS